MCYATGKIPCSEECDDGCMLSEDRSEVMKTILEIAKDRGDLSQRIAEEEISRFNF